MDFKEKNKRKLQLGGYTDISFLFTQKSQNTLGNSPFQRIKSDVVKLNVEMMTWILFDAVL